MWPCIMCQITHYFVTFDVDTQFIVQAHYCLCHVCASIHLRLCDHFPKPQIFKTNLIIRNEFCIMEVRSYSVCLAGNILLIAFEKLYAKVWLQICGLIHKINSKSAFICAYKPIMEVQARRCIVQSPFQTWIVWKIFFPNLINTMSIVFCGIKVWTFFVSKAFFFKLDFPFFSKFDCSKMDFLNLD